QRRADARQRTEREISRLYNGILAPLRQRTELPKLLDLGQESLERRRNRAGRLRVGKWTDNAQHLRYPFRLRRRCVYAPPPFRLDLCLGTANRRSEEHTS